MRIDQRIAWRFDLADGALAMLVAAQVARQTLWSRRWCRARPWCRR